MNSTLIAFCITPQILYQVWFWVIRRNSQRWRNKLVSDYLFMTFLMAIPFTNWALIATKLAKLYVETKFHQDGVETIVKFLNKKI